MAPSDVLMAWEPAPELRIEAVEVTSAEATTALRRYLAELETRFGRRIDVERSIAAAPEILAEPRGTFYLVRRGSATVGCGGLTFLPDRTAEVRRMWVDPSARGAGIGRRLLGHLEGAAAARGCTRVLLDTHGSLHEALGLYRGSGYRPTDPYNDNRGAEFWFEKRLELPPE